jgi:oxygen-independent coproporphyrinogen-3 oxidase
MTQGMSDDGAVRHYKTDFSRHTHVSTPVEDASDQNVQHVPPHNDAHASTNVTLHSASGELTTNSSASAVALDKHDSDADHAKFTAHDVVSYIERESTRRQSNKVLHGHPSPMYWKPLEKPLPDYLQKRVDCSSSINYEVNLYVGTPFCLKTKPSRCGFCLFPSEDYTGNKGVEAYLHYLEREFQLYQPYYRNDKLSSIYFGGGTPNLYHPEHYGQVMGFVDKLYGGVPEDIEKTLEGIPQLFNESKLRAIKSAGFNRISMGVQQLNDELIKYSGRKQTRKQVFDTLEHCQRFDLAASMDLIYGWPEQTMNDMLEDLKIAVGSGVHHITHYELNVAGRSDFASKKKRALLPSIATNIDMYHVARDFLIAQGFEQVTVYDWRRKTESDSDERYGRYDYEQNLHKFVDHDGEQVSATQQMCGIGFAAVNFHVNDADDHAANWVYMNHTSVQKYTESLDRNEFPVARGFQYNHRDVKLVWLFQTMQTMRINHSKYQRIFNEDLLQVYSAVWAELEKRGWITITDDEITFDGDGQYYIPMLQSLIASKRLEQIRAARQNKLDDIAVVVAGGCAG